MEEWKSRSLTRFWRRTQFATIRPGSAEMPKRVLQPFGEGDEALAAKHDMDVPDTAEGQAETVEPVRQQRAADSDPGAAHVGEVRQPHPAGLVDLAEDDLPLVPMQRAPLADAPLDGAPDAGPELPRAPTGAAPSTCP
jgi:hypothetical protein